MSQSKDQTLALNVRLKPSEPSAHPRATNYTNVGVAQGIAYLDFGFIEPALLAAIAKAAKDGQAAPNDQLNGGLGDALLDGGTGLDTYLYRTGQGQDRIVDADKIGTIIFDNQTLMGGIRRQGTPTDTYLSPNGQFTYVKQGADLVINGALTIQNFDFATGALGIKLADAGDLVDNAGPTINYVNGQPNVRYDGDATDNQPTFTAAANHEAYGYGGNDILNFEGGSAAFNHQLFGGDGHDELHGGAGQDRIYGEAGRDLIFAVEGDDVIDGGGDIDLIKGGLGQDVLSGGLGNDGLDGGSDDDVLFGGEGNDVLSGESVQLGATTTGDDYLDGEAGDDLLVWNCVVKLVLT